MNLKRDKNKYINNHLLACLHHLETTDLLTVIAANLLIRSIEVDNSWNAGCFDYSRKV